MNTIQLSEEKPKWLINVVFDVGLWVIADDLVGHMQIYTSFSLKVYIV